MPAEKSNFLSGEDAGMGVREASKLRKMSVTVAVADTSADSGGCQCPDRLSRREENAEPFKSEKEMEDFVRFAASETLRMADEEERREPR